jgi:sugar phosphate permease
VGAIIMLVDWKLTIGLHLFPALVIGFFLWRGLGAMNTVSSEKSTLASYLASLRSMFSDNQALALMISNTLIGMSRLSVLAFFPIYFMETLNYSAFGLGVYLALLYVTGIISQPIMGVLSDKIGRKWILLPSFFSMSVLYMAIVLVPKGIILAIIVALLGMFFYAILNMNQTAIMDVAPRQVQSSTMGVMGLVGLPFTLLSPVAAGYLVTGFGIESAFWFAGFTAMLAAITLVPIKFRRLS